MKFKCSQFHHLLEQCKRIELCCPLLPVKADSLPPAFSDGNWKGTYSVHAKAPFGGFTWDGYYNGDLAFESAAGTLDGLWTLHGAGQYSGSITGSATYLGGGKVGRTASVPNLLVEKIDVTVNIIAAGFPVSQTSSESGGGLDIKLVSSTCTQAVGDISTPVIGNYQSAGANPNVTRSSQRFARAASRK